MAITGTLEADFSSFNAAVQSAEVKLQAFEGASNKTTTALSRLTDEMPPRFEKVGASVGGVGTAATQAAGPVNTMRESLGSFDAALSGVGIHVGPVIRGLSELGDASGKTIGQLGGLATAGLALGVGMAAWGLTRSAMEFLGLDAAVAKAWTSVLGWGDAAQVAGAKQDTINAAIRNGADPWITYTEAIAFNTAKQKEFQAEAQKTNDAIARLDAPAKSAEQIAGWQAEIQLVRDSGVIAALTADLASHNFTMAELKERYKISIPALQEFDRELKASDEIVKSNAKNLSQLQKEVDASAAKRVQAAKVAGDAEVAAAQKWAAGMAELMSAGQGLKGVLLGIDGTVVESSKFYLAAGVSQETLAKMYGLTAIQIRAITEAYREETAAKKASTDETNRGTAATTTNIATLQQAAETVHTLAGEYISLAAAQKLHEMGGSATIPDLTPQQAEMMGGREAIERQVALGRPTNPGTNTREGYADLAKRQAAYEAMVRYLAGLSDVSSAALGNLASSAVGAFGQGGGVTQIVTINVNGTAADVARKVAEEIMKTAKRGRRFS
jgi:hypothetical protein